MNPDIDQLKMFWREWPHAGEHLVITTLGIAENPLIETRSFLHKTENNLANFLAYIQSEQRALRNCYFTFNPVRKPINAKRKAKREEIAEVAYLHADCDPHAFDSSEMSQEDIDKYYTSERERLLTFPSSSDVPAPSFVIFSGGGVNMYWRLKKPIPLDGTIADADDKSLYNRGLEAAVGGDNVKDVCRFLRLPGTVNFPNEKKQAKGRTEKLAEIIEFHPERCYDISQFKKATAQEAAAAVRVNVDNVQRIGDINDLGNKVSDLAKVCIVQGTDPDLPSRFPSRSEALHFVTCELVRADLGNDEIYSIITDPEFRISASVLDKGSGMEAYATRQIERARERNAAPDWVSKLNANHAIIKNYGGKCVVFIEHDRQVSHQSRGDFIAANARKRVKVGTSKDGLPVYELLGKAWFFNKAAREYERVVFLPAQQVPDGTYNLFRGWTVQPKPGKCDLFLNYVRNIVCGQNDKHYNWLMNWTAHMFQRPWEPPEVAVVLRGPQGVGKGFFVDRLGDLLGPYYTPVNSQRQLLGNFNSHLKNAILVFADEVFGTAKQDKQGLLKTLVTQPYVVIEPKGVDAMKCDKFLRLIMASNLDWAVPADIDDRRFFVKDMFHPLQDDKPGKIDYFKNIMFEWAQGGKEAFLAVLLTRELSNYNHRLRPDTAELTRQKTYTFRGARRLIYDLLRNGALPHHLLKDKRFFVVTTLLAKEHDFTSRDYTAISRELGAISGTESTRETTVEGKQEYGHWLPVNLAACREKWALHHGIPDLDWGDGRDEFRWTELKEAC